MAELVDWQRSLILLAGADRSRKVGSVGGVAD
jgi:hypothetical protein